MWKDSETNVDLLDFDYLVEVTKNIILDDKLTPSTIGVYGDWGSGKSSLMDMVSESFSKDKDVLCVKFNGWLFEGYEDAKTALIGSILDAIKSKATVGSKAKRLVNNLIKNTDFIKLTSKLTKYGVDLFLTGGVLTIADLSTDFIRNKLLEKGGEVGAKEIENSMKAFKGEELRKNVTTFHKDFANLLKETKIKRLVVFIDELDRCNHETILHTLEAIRLFLFAEGTSFVIGADERQIRYAVQMKYPDVDGYQMDIGKEYLEKLIQYPVRIPQLGPKEVEQYIMFLFFEKDFLDDLEEIKRVVSSAKKDNFLEFELSYELIKEHNEVLANKLKDTISMSKQISSVLATGLNGNPRHCKRYLNTMELRIQMAEFRGVDLDRRVLGKIMLAEYFKDSFYTKLAELQSDEEGRPKELSLIEEGEWGDVKELGVWEKDSWVSNWIGLDPKLANCDLRPYFYFSRESLNSVAFVKQKNLSPDAQNVLEKLLSATDTQRRSAIQEASRISVYEAMEILKLVAQRVEIDTEVKSKLFQSYIEWGSTKKELHSELLAGLERLSIDKIKAAFLPHITEFAKKLDSSTRILELYDDWSKKTSLKSAIKGEIEQLKGE